jgi:hypothetical protein
VIPHRSHTIKQAYGTTDIDIITINSDDTFKTDAILQASHDQRRYIQPYFRQ